MWKWHQGGNSVAEPGWIAHVDPVTPVTNTSFLSGSKQFWALTCSALQDLTLGGFTHICVRVLLSLYTGRSYSSVCVPLDVLSVCMPVAISHNAFTAAFHTSFRALVHTLLPASLLLSVLEMTDVRICDMYVCVLQKREAVRGFTSTQLFPP